MMQSDFSGFGAPENESVDSITVSGNPVKVGDRVRLWPGKSADILDLALRGKFAVIEAIERDFDDVTHLAVVLEDDPGKDLGMLRQPGHRFFFSPEEIEPNPDPSTQISDLLGDASGLHRSKPTAGLPENSRGGK